MKMLILPRYGALGASSRLRTLQYVPALRAAGIEVEVSPLLDDGYVRGLYSGSVPVSGVVRSYFRRLWRAIELDRFDVVWVEKEAWPWLPTIGELPLLDRATRLVVDYDDAVFHRYDLHRSPVVRRLLGRKIDSVMRRADIVVVGNDYLAERARAAGSRRVEWLPTVVDLERYPMVDKPAPTDGRIVVGWIGSPSTADYLRVVSSLLEPLRVAGIIRCVAIGARPDQLAGTPFVAERWSEETEVAALHRFDIGIMPLPDESWERGKCGYKLIQYMACGVPVVASPVGVNTQIVSHGENGFLAPDDAGWSDSLHQLISDPALRVRMGLKGRARVEQTYCLQIQAPRLVAMFRDMN